jgi:hypothetical protein
MLIIWLLYGCYMATIWLIYGYYVVIMIIWLLHGYYMSHKGYATSKSAYDYIIMLYNSDYTADRFLWCCNYHDIDNIDVCSHETSCH